MLNHVHITPRHLKSHLDQFVISQIRAKRILSVAVFNHYLRIQHLIQRHADDDEVFRSTAAVKDDSEPSHQVMSDFPGQTSGEQHSARMSSPLSIPLVMTKHVYATSNCLDKTVRVDCH